VLINIVFFDDESIIRTATRIMTYFKNDTSVRTTNDTIWLKDMHFRFHTRTLTVNFVNTNSFSKKRILECFNSLLDGEEIFVTDEFLRKKYINSVNIKTKFDEFFVDCMV